MTALYTRWRFDNYKKGKFNIAKKIMKKIVKLCLHLGYIHRTEHFDDIFFHGKFQNLKIPILAMLKL